MSLDLEHSELPLTSKYVTSHRPHSSYIGNSLWACFRGADCRQRAHDKACHRHSIWSNHGSAHTYHTLGIGRRSYLIVALTILFFAPSRLQPLPEDTGATPSAISPTTTIKLGQVSTHNFKYFTTLSLRFYWIGVEPCRVPLICVQRRFRSSVGIDSRGL